MLICVAVIADNNCVFVDLELLEKYAGKKGAFKYYTVKNDKAIPKVISLNKKAADYKEIQYVKIGTVGSFVIVCDAEFTLRIISAEDYAKLVSAGHIVYEYGYEIAEERFGWGLKKAPETEEFLNSIRRHISKLKLLGIPKAEMSDKIVEYIKRYIKQSGKGYDELIGSQSYFIDGDNNLCESFEVYEFFSGDSEIALLGTDCLFFDCAMSLNNTLFTRDVFVTASFRALWSDSQVVSQAPNEKGRLRVIHADDIELLKTKYGVLNCEIDGLTECVVDMFDDAVTKYRSTRDEIVAGDLVLSAKYDGVFMPNDVVTVVGNFKRLTLKNLYAEDVISRSLYTKGPEKPSVMMYGNVPYINTDYIRAEVLELVDCAVLPDIYADKLILTNICDNAAMMLDWDVRFYRYRVIEIRAAKGIPEEFLQVSTIEEVQLTGKLADYTDRLLMNICNAHKCRTIPWKTPFKLTIADSAVEKRLNELLGK